MNLVREKPKLQSMDVLASTWENSRPHGFYLKTKRKKETSTTFVTSNHIEIFQAEAIAIPAVVPSRDVPPCQACGSIFKETPPYLLDQERI
ncbi:hypothetical protein HNY73_002640 [Argiope bruennichi]|uniref:Uncharacterized protein n=1 Tax=Argiope bruennichi TaxID=94029 RepID=A0A8T0FWX1_ARGBR|nr:hypothetical protein HNY73_002640 [Argiope bruennichi]